MYLPFDQLTAESRIWIYQANREFTEAEEKVILAALRSFCEQWTAHGASLRTSFQLAYHQFLVLALDESFNGASGCSIDGSVQVLKSLQHQLGLDFFDRSSAAFLIGGKVKLIPLKDLRQSFATGTLSQASLAFNTQASEKGELESSWIVPAEKTWMTKYIPNNAVA